MNVTLRDVEAADLPIFFEHQRDPEAAAMAAFRSRDAAAFEEHWAKLLADDTTVKRTIVADDRVVGSIGSFTREGKREVGYWIDRACWGRGIATAALAAFLRIDPARPLYAVVAQHNAGSLRVAQRCGFTLDTSSAADADSPVMLTLILRQA